MNLIKSISLFNTENFSQSDLRIVRIANLIPAIATLATTLYSLFYLLVLHSPAAAALTEVFALLYLLYYFHFKKYGYYSAINTFTVLYIVHVTVIVVFYASSRTGFHFFLLLSGPLAHLLYIRGKDWISRITISTLSLLMFLLCEISGNRFSLLELPPWQFRAVYLVTISSVFLLFILINHTNRQEIDIRETELKISHDKSRMTMKTFGVGYWEWDHNGKIFKYDDMWHKSLGYREGKREVDLTWLTSRIDPESFKVIKQASQDYSEGKTAQFEAEYKIKARNGQWRWIQAVGIAEEWDGKGRPLRILGAHKDITDRKELEINREALIGELKTALSELRTLSGLLPICASCKKIRDDKGYWNKIETYIEAHTGAEFTHGLCPDCMKDIYPKQFEKMQEGTK